MENPLLGMLLLSIGALGGGSFYVPFSKVKKWSWETYWLSMGVVAWYAAPLLTAWLTVPDLREVLLQAPLQSIALAFSFGVMWGVGSVACGLAFRYLGISLGMSVVMGLCAAFGTLIPPLVDGRFGQMLVTLSGWTVLAGVAICLVGIALCGVAGMCKERELTHEQKQEGVKEFALVKGFILAAISGVLSAALPYGIYAGKPIAQAALHLGTPPSHQNNPVFLVVVAGGLTVNAVFCLILGAKNRSMGQYVAGPVVLLLRNYALVALAGVLWYSGIVFYGMALTTMGKYDFAAWSISTALAIVCSTLWGLALGEWKGAGRPAMRFLGAAIAVLILSAIVIGAGSRLASVGV